MNQAALWLVQETMFKAAMMCKMSQYHTQLMYYSVLDLLHWQALRKLKTNWRWSSDQNKSERNLRSYRNNHPPEQECADMTIFSCMLNITQKSHVLVRFKNIFKRPRDFTLRISLQFCRSYETVKVGYVISNVFLERKINFNCFLCKILIESI